MPSSAAWLGLLTNFFRFLLAKLHMDSLAKKDNRRDIRRALPNLPKELDDTYEEAMKRILNQDPDKMKRAMQVLSWISYALGPLTVSDIRHALAVEPGDTNLDEDALPHEDLLVSVCAGLVTIDQGSNVIRLVHYTTQQYFERIREARFPKAQTTIAMTCLTYLSFEEFAKGHSPSDQEMETRLRRYPLLDYAARHWGTHARGEPEEAIKESALKFLTHNSKLMCSNQVMHLQEYRYANYSQRFPKDVTGLHVAASFGLATIARLLLENDVNLAAKTESGSTALHWAAKNGHQEVVRLFLEKGTSIDDNSKSPVLHLAAENCHEEVVRLLLEKGVSVDMSDDSGRKALHLAARKGHEKVVQLLLDKGADIDAKDDANESTALHEAAENGKETVVKLLLEKGATVELKDADGRIALHWASEGGHETVVPLLLQKGVKINLMDNFGWTALGSAVERGHVAVVHLLLENGADIEAKNGGLTALQWAAERGNEEVLRLLLEKGADIGAKDDHGKTALHRATARGHATIVQQLLAKKIDLATTDENGNTALHEAAEAGYETVAQLLLDSGCDIKAKIT
jgi:ankyrin repeat protein